MNTSLFLAMLRTNGRAILGYAIGSAMYLLICLLIYPSIANSSDALNQMIQKLPEGMVNAFGLAEGIQGLNGFLASEFYGLIFILIMMIYCVLTATQLVARLVDRGSMAYLLSTPVSRFRIALTQASVLIFGLLVIAVLTTAGGWLGSRWILEDRSLDGFIFVQINLVGFLLFFVISGYAFLFSCLFNDEKRALAVSGGLTVTFFAMNFAGKMSSDLEWMRSLTPFAAFRPSEISRGAVDVLPVGLGLGAAGIALYVAAIGIFRKRDLPL